MAKGKKRSGQGGLIEKGDKALRAGLSAKRAGRLGDARAQYQRAAKLYSRANSSQRRALALVNLGALEQHQGKLGAAQSAFEEARLLSEGDALRIALCEGNLAAIHLERGNDQEAEPLLHASLERYEAAGEFAGAGNQLGNLGLLYQNRGDYDRALQYLDRAARAFVAAGHAGGAASTLRVVGEIHRRTGDSATAEEAFERALTLSRQIEDQQGEAYARRALGQMRMARGEVDRGRAHFKLAHSLHEQLGDLRGLSAAKVDLGQATIALGEVDEGLGILEEAVRLCREQGQRNDALASALVALGVQLGQSGSSERGFKVFAEAEEVYSEIKDPHGQAGALINRISLYVVRGRWEEASRTLAEAEELVKEVGLKPLEAAILGLKGQLAQLKGDLRLAYLSYSDAKEGFSRFERKRLEASATLNLAVVAGELRLDDDHRAALESIREEAASHRHHAAVADADQALAELARQRGDLEGAARRYLAALETIRSLTHPAALAGVLASLGELSLRFERWYDTPGTKLDEAQAYLDEAAKLTSAHELLPRGAMVGVWRAEIARRREEPWEEALLLARARARKLGYRLCEGVSYQVEARARREARDVARFAEAIAKAKEIFEEMGAHHHLIELLEDFDLGEE